MIMNFDLKEIERDLNEYLTKKYGPGFRLVGVGPHPEPASEYTGEEEAVRGGGVVSLWLSALT